MDASNRKPFASKSSRSPQSDRDRAPVSAPKPPSTPNPQPLVPEVREVNEQCLAHLQRLAQSAEDPGSHFLVASLRGRLQPLTPIERSRIADRAFLLVDLQFANDPYWLKHPSRNERATPRSGYFPREIALPLCRSTLVLAWYTARAKSKAARVMLGMSARVCSHFASIPLQDLDRLARVHWQELKPRWSNQPSLWHEILLLSRSHHPSRTREIDLWGLQLIAGAVIQDNHTQHAPDVSAASRLT